MKPYVHLQGAGQEVTVITSTVGNSTWSPSQATLILAGDTSLRDLSVGNSGADTHNVAILATAGLSGTQVGAVTVQAQGSGDQNHAILLLGDGVEITLVDVSALAENGNDNYGLHIQQDVSATLRNSSFISRGGDFPAGIWNESNDQTIQAISVRALGEDGNGFNRGLLNEQGTVILRGGTYTGRGGVRAVGIKNTYTSTLKTETVTVLGENGHDNIGLFSDYLSVADLHGGTFTGRGGSYAFGIYNRTTTLTAQGVNALGEDGATENSGLVTSGGLLTRLYRGTFIGRGGNMAHGIDDSNTDLVAEGVTARGEGGMNSSHGLECNEPESVTLRHSSFIGDGGGGAVGIWTTGTNLVVEAEFITAMGVNSSGGNSGFANNEAQFIHIDNSKLVGTSYIVLNNIGSMTIANTRFSGGIVDGAVTCVAVTKASLFYQNSCP
jgi:hypothetical protein